MSDPVKPDFVVSIEDSSPPRVRVGELGRQPIDASLDAPSDLDLREEGRRFRAAMVTRARTRLAREVQMPVMEVEPASLSERRFGAALFDALFPRDHYHLYESWRKRPGKGRVRLRVDAGWAAVPWELLRNERAGGGLFLGVDDATPLVREVATTVDFPPPAELGSGGLQVLAVGANPIDLPGISVDRERELLKEALKGAGTVDWQDVNEDDLAALLRDPAAKYHVFHFAGHGSFDGREGHLYLGTGASEKVSAERLAVTLGRCPTLRLVVLNACEGAAPGEETDAISIAARLVAGGIPAVLAMQAPILDETALEVVRDFYRALAQGRSVECAVSDLRLHLQRKGCEWPAPVLTMGDPGKPLFLQNTTPTPERPPVSLRRGAEPSPWRLAGCLALIVLGMPLLGAAYLLFGREDLQGQSVPPTTSPVSEARRFLDFEVPRCPPPGGCTPLVQDLGSLSVGARVRAGSEHDDVECPARTERRLFAIYPAEMSEISVSPASPTVYRQRSEHTNALLVCAPTGTGTIYLSLQLRAGTNTNSIQESQWRPVLPAPTAGIEFTLDFIQVLDPVSGGPVGTVRGQGGALVRVKAPAARGKIETIAVSDAAVPRLFARPDSAPPAAGKDAWILKGSAASSDLLVKFEDQTTNARCKLLTSGALLCRAVPPGAMPVDRPGR